MSLKPNFCRQKSGHFLQKKERKETGKMLYSKIAMENWVTDSE